MFIWQNPFYCYKGLYFLPYVKSNKQHPFQIWGKWLTFSFSFLGMEFVFEAQLRDIPGDTQNGFCSELVLITCHERERGSVRGADLLSTSLASWWPPLSEQGSHTSGPQPLCGHLEGPQFPLLSKCQ